MQAHEAATGHWLEGLVLGQYEAAFRANAIDAATADDLKKLGATAVGSCHHSRPPPHSLPPQRSHPAIPPGDRGHHARTVPGTVLGTVQSLVQARLDRLAPTDRQAPQAASVLGQRFAGDAFSALLADTGYHPDRADAQHFVGPEGEGYLFAHARANRGYASPPLSSSITSAPIAIFEQVLALARQLGAPRFEAEAPGCRAELEPAAGRARAARAAIGEALAMARRTGMAYMEPAYLGILARLVDDPASRAAALAEAEALLAQGSPSHNHLMFRREAIEACLAAN